MKKIVFFLITALFTINPVLTYAQRGTIEQAVPIAVLTPTEIMQALHQTLDEQSYSMIDLFTCKKYNVQAVKIIYHTIDGTGAPTLAAGVVFLPVTGTLSYMPVFSYLHGTLTKFDDVPSNLSGIESITGWIMAMDGYISVLPDYIGMGVVPGIHPYLHAASEASASIDMLIAMNWLCSKPEVPAKPNGNLYLSGYSQGAHAALATQRELERNPLPFLTLRKTVAGSGAYSLSAIQKNYMFDHPYYSNPAFIPYLLLGFQSIYGNLYNNLNDVFIPPYNNTMPGYFNGSHDVDAIDAMLPSRWKDMFVPSYLWNFQYKYFNPVNAALRNNDLINWKPSTPLHLYYCTCDEQVAKENSMLAYLTFVLKGSKSVTCLPVGPYDHVSCAPFVLLLAKIQFDCASGNSCGLKASPVINRDNPVEEGIAMFNSALDLNKTLDLNEVYANRLIREYMNGEFGKVTSLEIYPNPSRDQVFIEIPADLPANSRILVFDMLGKLVLDKNVSGSIIDQNIKALQQGLYKVVVTGDQTYSGKLSVIH